MFEPELSHSPAKVTFYAALICAGSVRRVPFLFLLCGHKGGGGALTQLV